MQRVVIPKIVLGVHPRLSSKSKLVAGNIRQKTNQEEFQEATTFEFFINFFLNVIKINKVTRIMKEIFIHLMTKGISKPDPCTKASIKPANNKDLIKIIGSTNDLKIDLIFDLWVAMSTFIWKFSGFMEPAA